MGAIPLCLLEEHHEAFLLWHWAARTGRIAGRGNVLLHVDEHSDLRAPGTAQGIFEGNPPLARIAAQVYGCLDITNFIWPALRQGIFDRVCWLRWAHDPSLKARFVPLRSEPAKDARAEAANLAGTASGKEGSGGFWLIPVKPGQVFTEGGPVVLDIDLDFFLCDNAAGGRLDIEITPAEYEAWRRDRYHKVRLLLGGRARALRSGDRHWLRFAPVPRRPVEARKAWAQVRERIEVFGNFLLSNRMQPRLIGICRSRRSGYTPPAWCERIELELMPILGGLYDLEVRTVADLRREAHNHRGGGGSEATSVKKSR